MSRDLTGLLEDWPYEPNNTTRIVTANDERKVLQVRLPLGIEQYELVGRPDGEQPFGKQTVLEEMESRLAEYVLMNGTDDGFLLAHDDCELLQTEAILFYYRYLLLFQINDYERVAADTEHNLRMCHLFENYCDSEEHKEGVLQYKPYIVRMNSMARAMRSMKRGEHGEAAEIIDVAIEQIEGMDELDSPAFQFERVRSVNYLKSALKQLGSAGRGSHARRSLESTLKKQLDEAVREEDYERAAELRDQIRTMRTNGPER